MYVFFCNLRRWCVSVHFLLSLDLYELPLYFVNGYMNKFCNCFIFVRLWKVLQPRDLAYYMFVCITSGIEVFSHFMMMMNLHASTRYTHIPFIYCSLTGYCSLCLALQTPIVDPWDVSSLFFVLFILFCVFRHCY